MYILCCTGSLELSLNVLEASRSISFEGGTVVFFFSGRSKQFSLIYFLSSFLKDCMLCGKQ